MTKHAPSFKHLLGRVTHREQRREPTVAELLANSRAQQAVAPVRVQEPDIHPAELLRREREEHDAERRRVAGPAPPKSWWKRTETPQATAVDAPQPTDSEIADAIEFLKDPHVDASPRHGAPSLATICCDLTVALLRDNTAVEGERISDIVLPAVLQLEPHLRERVLEVARGRLADDQVRAILTHKPEPPGLGEENEYDAGDEGEEDWDRDDDTTITSLCIPSHPAPGRMLRTVDLSVLTSVNLAFCRIPDLTRLVLPPSLRSLGLRGVYSGLPRYKLIGTTGDSGTAGQKRRNDEDLLWAAQGLTALGKRLILLKGEAVKLGVALRDAEPSSGQALRARYEPGSHKASGAPALFHCPSECDRDAE
ncbi:hypothetical protein A1Q1_03774 [Trichosporon asahii var. asahii CBS 2479]|uniref:Uncharacterized protein n=1 Tax=Trichosporon asahii var. asahii (strain ATCC 90039 / CBS 2479 / JCM 2466 / KCTC 7840 / NBRC 103889/ NCYC 2677 / UAMH 7654) TaxID=1186058 RepID=J5RGF8_TRIAS|nr:hypothetical protein A1Q1_03774 [Trichosporon asahii var. asahii CBS 2479]EJT52493.1 hypothetical protein A1Q1_03774 [Trichosporon asahii var. asahii CBS 2479]